MLVVAGVGAAVAWIGFGAVHQADAPESIPAGTASPEPGTPAPDPFPAAVQLAQRTLLDPTIDELSGLAASRLHPGVLYGINDSGGSASVYAIDDAGATVATLSLAGVDARDWESLAPGRAADGSPVLWIGDIGDNSENQSRVRLLEIDEPAELVDQDVAFRSFWIAYEDGPHNAEALVVHPSDGRVWVATKGNGEPGGLYRAPGELSPDRTTILEYVRPVPPSITGGDWELSAAAEPRLVLIDYWRIHRLEGNSWVSKLGPLQLQREAMAWPWLPDAPDNDRVLLGSEGAGSGIVVGDVP